ncbi:hypothetical protein [Treponema sp.]|uniref:hypothetical protein n=1 Tax=Treponema sp. TaxID=166 RepID=UPI003F017993
MPHKHYKAVKPRSNSTMRRRTKFKRLNQKAECPKIEKDAFCIAGEMNEESVQKKLLDAGCTDVLDIVRNASLSF